MRRRRFLAWGKNLLVLLAGTAFFLVATEVVLRVALPAPLRYRYPQPRHDRDPELGWFPRASQESFTIDRPVRTNAMGFRSPELAAPGTPGLFRVVCLGDSQTWGNGVGQEETYPRRLEAELAARLPGRRVEVVNAGVQGYDTVQEVDLLARLAGDLRPDAVTIGFYVNDISEAGRTDKFQRVEQETGGSHRRGWKGLVPDRVIYLAKRSALVTFVGWRLRILRYAGKANPAAQVLRGESVPRLEEGWRRIAGSLTKARDLAATHGFHLLVFPVPAALEFQADYPGERYRSRLAEVVGGLGIDTADPTPALKAQGSTLASHFIAWDGHLGPAAHRYLGEFLAERIAAGAGATAPATGR